MLTIAICDDDRMCREEAAECCRQYGEEQKLDYELKIYASGEELLENQEMDILLLDVEMTGIDGLQVKEILRRQKADTRILFISSHQEVITEAFGSQVYGFLKKPLDYKKFQERMDIVLEDLAEQNRYVLCETPEGTREISLSQIQYIEADGKYTKIHLDEEDVFSDKSVGTWNDELENCDFAMCHRSYLVNLWQITSVTTEVILKNLKRIPLSRRMTKEFQVKYKEFIWRKAR